MTEYHIAAIYQTMVEFGPSVLSTPRMFEAMSAQRSKGSPNEIAALVAVVKSGAVQDMWARPDTEIMALTGSIAGRTGLPAHTARWALEVWQRSLDYFRRGETPPLPDVDTLRAGLPGKALVGHVRQAVAAAALVALIGASAGGLPGLLASEGMKRNDTQANHFRQMLERHESPGSHMEPPQILIRLGSLGMAGGLIGSTLGWLAGQHRYAPTRAFAGAIGALWAFDGAVFGAAHYGLYGAFCGSLFLSAVMTFIAAMLGPIAVALLVKQALWLLVRHF